jgi:chemotaxis signal transduction protein
VTRPLSLRLYRAPVDGSRTVFFATIDRAIPLVDGVTIIGDRGDITKVVDAANGAGLAAVARRWEDRRRAVVIQDRRLVEVA